MANKPKKPKENGSGGKKVRSVSKKVKQYNHGHICNRCEHEFGCDGNWLCSLRTYRTCEICLDKLDKGSGH
jgi:hypothetical protein